MEKVLVHNYEYAGSNYEIGQQLGQTMMEHAQFIQTQKSEVALFTDDEVAQMNKMFDRYCPGLSEELEGFAEAIGASVHQLYYYGGTYLKPGCSILAVLPQLTANGHVLVARNYEFSHKVDDFSFGKTKVNGKYAHIGSSSMLFGRSEGINECGLMVAPTSCGLPVGNFEPMKKPAIHGLQFWAVIRSLLENCKDVEEALGSVLDMPIAYNINLVLADKTGKAVLFETYDGKKAWRMIDAQSDEQYIHSTNHAHLPEIKQLAPLAMEHSLCRYDMISRYMGEAEKVSIEDLKAVLLAEYPKGLCCHWYEEFFGTIRSMVFDVTSGSIEVCWGGLVENKWKRYTLEDEIREKESSIFINVEHPDFDFCKLR